MSNKNQKELSKLWKNAVDWSDHSDRPHTYNGTHANTYINMYYSETSCYSEADAFASDIATSVPFVDPEDPNHGIDMDVFDQMQSFPSASSFPCSNSHRPCVPLASVSLGVQWKIGWTVLRMCLRTIG